VEEPKDKREKSKLQAIGGDLNKSARVLAIKKVSRKTGKKKFFALDNKKKKKIRKKENNLTAHPGTIKIF
jgi:hypothetical protein